MGKLTHTGTSDELLVSVYANFQVVYEKKFNSSSTVISLAGRFYAYEKTVKKSLGHI